MAEETRPSFYRHALEVADQLALDSALERQGVDEEIALLRVELLQMASENDNSNSVEGGRVTLFKGLETLAKLVALRHRMSMKQSENLAANVRRLVQELEEAVELEEATLGR